MSSNKVNELVQLIQNKVEAIAQTCVGEVSEKVLSETIEEVVYEGEFQPYGENPYIRRHTSEGGYGDEDSLKTVVDKNSDGSITVITTNEAVGVGSEYGERLDKIIEEGNPYLWKHKPPERPVFAIAKAKIRDNKKEIVNSIKNTLIANNIKVD